MPAQIPLRAQASTTSTRAASQPNNHNLNTCHFNGEFSSFFERKIANALIDTGSIPRSRFSHIGWVFTHRAKCHAELLRKIFFHHFFHVFGPEQTAK